MSAFADTLYHQPYISDKKEIYLEFIRKVLTMYQRNKNLFTKFAPDVYFEDIKNSLASPLLSHPANSSLLPDSQNDSPFIDDIKMQDMMHSVAPVHHSRGKRRRPMEESSLSAPIMNDMFDPQYISQSSTSSMLIPQISILQSMSSNLPSMVQIPMSQILSQPQNSLLSTPSVAPSTVDGPIGVMDQGGIDVGGSVPMSSTLALDVKPDEMALKEEGKAVTFHLCQMEEGRSGQEGVQMDDKRVKGMYVQCCFVCWILVWWRGRVVSNVCEEREGEMSELGNGGRKVILSCGEKGCKGLE